MTSMDKLLMNAIENVEDKVETMKVITHTHPISDITSLQTKLDSINGKITPCLKLKEAVGTYNVSSTYATITKDDKKESYEIKDDHTIRIQLLQNNTTKRNIHLRTATAPVTVVNTIDYQLEGDWESYTNAGDTTTYYCNYTTIDLSTLTIPDEYEGTDLQLSIGNGLGGWYRLVLLDQVTEIKSDLQVNGTLKIGDKTLIDTFYPIGSIFTTSDSSQKPGTLYSGTTWEQISTEKSDIYMYKRTA